MPLFEQRCKQCGNQFEIIVLSANSEAARPCPECGANDTVQLVSRCSFRMVTRPFEIKRGRCHNAYENLTLQHVRDEHGKAVKVNSEAELHAAEKRYGFVHAASAGLPDAPQHEAGAGQIYTKEQRKWNHNAAAYSPEAVAEAAKEVGYVKSADETLANRPNPV